MSERIRVASYNIHKAVGLDQRRDPMRILEVVNGMDADVVALQEVDRRMGPRPSVLDRKVIETETDFQVAGLARNDVSLGWHGNAVLVRKGLTILDVDHITLPGLEPRGAVQVNVAKGGAEASVVGVHLGLLRPYRRQQLRTILDHLGADGKANSLILGDFNEWSERRGLEELADGFDIVSPGKSFHAARLLAGLDRIALGRAMTLYDAGVTETPLSRVASDHLPIWSDVDLLPKT